MKYYKTYKGKKRPILGRILIITGIAVIAVVLLMIAGNALKNKVDRISASDTTGAAESASPDETTAAERYNSSYTHIDDDGSAGFVYSVSDIASAASAKAVASSSADTTAAATIAAPVKKVAETSSDVTTATDTVAEPLPVNTAAIDSLITYTVNSGYASFGVYFDKASSAMLSGDSLGSRETVQLISAVAEMNSFSAAYMMPMFAMYDGSALADGESVLGDVSAQLAILADMGFDEIIIVGMFESNQLSDSICDSIMAAADTFHASHSGITLGLELERTSFSSMATAPNIERLYSAVDFFALDLRGAGVTGDYAASVNEISESLHGSPASKGRSFARRG